VVEARLHRSWPGVEAAPAGPGPVTKAYADHLLAASAAGSYAELVAAVLPCYWLYAEVGEVLHGRYTERGDAPAHPYGAWLETYADPEFALATRTAVAHLDAAARAASGAERERMRAAFTQSARYELEFFGAPSRFGAP
jgi:hydroxymethylpyrimidine/phosphomethylpyrimidine kinase